MVICVVIMIIMITSSKAMIRLDHHVSAGNLYGDVHALANAGVRVHHLVLRQEQALFVPPREVPGPDAHSVDYQDHCNDNLDSRYGDIDNSDGRNKFKNVLPVLLSSS